MNEWKLYSQVTVFSFTANGGHRLPKHIRTIHVKKNNNDKKEYIEWFSQWRHNSEVLRILINTRLKINKK